MYTSAYHFKQASYCPLKYSYTVEEDRSSRRIPYKAETKVMLRRALKLLLPDGYEAANDHETAIRQTNEWLNQEKVTIYGGVINWENCHARIPVITRDKNRVTLYQIQGKVWKQQQKELPADLDTNRKRWIYAREAAYKVWIFRKQFPDWETKIKICFPNSRFRADIPGLYEKVAFEEARKENIESLFVIVDANKATERVLNDDTDQRFLHHFFRDKTLAEQMEWIAHHNQDSGRDSEPPFKITNACKHCSFRKVLPGNSGNEGCWEKHMKGEFRQPSSHVYDLIGSGNEAETANQRYLQEQVPLPGGIHHFNDLEYPNSPVISIRERRLLQLLCSQGKPVPGEWVKYGLKKNLNSIDWPVHFIDFEAATSALPMDSGARPYQPRLFQYSCHTLHQDGRLEHYQWLDENVRVIPKNTFIKHLAAVRNIESGIIIQYSPFEKQSLNHLYRELKKVNSPDVNLLSDLEKILFGESEGDRFLDMSRLVRDYYYNRQMKNGLGLKEVLFSTIATSSFLKSKYSEPVEICGEKIRLIRLDKDGNINEDPYSLIQEEQPEIEDGSSAMHAWLYTKTPYCELDHRKMIQRALRRYCTMDSLAMVLIFQHWKNLIDNVEQKEDIVVW